MKCGFVLFDGLKLPQLVQQQQRLLEQYQRDKATSDRKRYLPIFLLLGECRSV